MALQKYKDDWCVNCKKVKELYGDASNDVVDMRRTD